MARATAGVDGGAVLAAVVFVVVALATTTIVRESGRQIVDTGRYQEYGDAMRDGLVPYRDFPVEYPPGALPLFAAPALPRLGATAYFWGFAWMMAIAGAIGVVLTGAALTRLRRPARVRGAVLALLAISPVCFGGVILTRFDLVPAALIAAATLLLLGDRHRSAAVTLGVAVAVKGYPLAVLPFLVAWAWRRRGAREATVAAGLSVGAVALTFLPFLLLAPAGVGSSVWGQLSRPLQIETLAAGLLLLAHDAAGLEAVVETSSGSQNLVGEWADALATVGSILSLVLLGGVWTTFIRGQATPERLVRWSAAALLALVAFGKVLSPQFLVWPLFPLALVAGRRGVAAGACFAVASVLTTAWFPFLYFDLLVEGRDPLVAALVTLRGVALVAAFCVLAWPATSREARPPP